MANEITKQESFPMSNSEKFTSKVLREFGQISPGLFRISDYQKQLLQGYFIQIDRALKIAEENRLRNNKQNSDHEKYDNPDPIGWGTIDLNALALEVMHYAKMGLDITQKNMLFAIPYKDNSRTVPSGTKMYVVNLMLGYSGIQYISERYAAEKPKAVTVELVYSTDTFSPVKKSRTNNIEGYDFKINNAFDRGEVIGGFGYIEYSDPIKNKLIMMSRKDIEKRKPPRASVEFWGGKKKKWENGHQVETESEGWYEEMCIKTIMREVYNPRNIPIDPRMVDDDYQYMRQQEIKLAQMTAQEIVETNTATQVIDIDIPEPESAGIPEITQAGKEFETMDQIAEAEKVESTKSEPLKVEPAPDNDGQMFIPGF
jgi:recombination protein RecT